MPRRSLALNSALSSTLSNALSGSLDRGNGQAVDFLTTDKVLFKFYEKFILGKKSEYIDDDGSVIKVPGAQYDTNGVRKLY